MPPIATVCAIILTAASVTACFPWSSPGYEPHGTGVKYGRPGCSMNYGTLMRFKLEAGASLDVSLTFEHDPNPLNRVRVLLALQSHQRAQFESFQVAIQTDGKQSQLFIPIPNIQIYLAEKTLDQHMYRTEGGSISPGEYMKGRLPSSPGAEQESSFVFRVDLPFTSPTAFALVLPPMIIDGQRVVIKPIHFTYGQHPRLVNWRAADARAAMRQKQAAEIHRPITAR